MEALAREAAQGGVHDLPAPPLEVLIADPRHDINIKRMSALDKDQGLEDAGDKRTGIRFT